MMKSSGAYELAMAHATGSPAIEQRLGSPIESGFLVTGSFETSGASGSADLSIPISGPKGKARIYIRAQRIAGQWEPDLLIVQFPDSHRVNLLQEP